MIRRVNAIVQQYQIHVTTIAKNLLERTAVDFPRNDHRLRRIAFSNTSATSRLAQQCRRRSLSSGQLHLDSSEKRSSKIQSARVRLNSSQRSMKKENFRFSQFYDPKIVFVRSRRMQSRRSRCTVHARNSATGTRLSRFAFGQLTRVDQQNDRPFLPFRNVWKLGYLLYVKHFSS